MINSVNVESIWMQLELLSKYVYASLVLVYCEIGHLHFFLLGERHDPF